MKQEHAGQSRLPTCYIEPRLILLGDINVIQGHHGANYDGTYRTDQY